MKAKVCGTKVLQRKIISQTFFPNRFIRLLNVSQPPGTDNFLNAV